MFNNKNIQLNQAYQTSLHSCIHLRQQRLKIAEEGGLLLGISLDQGVQEVQRSQ